MVCIIIINFFYNNDYIKESRSDYFYSYKSKTLHLTEKAKYLNNQFHDVQFRGKISEGGKKFLGICSSIL